MEDFKSMPLGELINLWLDLATPDFDLLNPSDQYYQKKKKKKKKKKKGFGIFN